MQNSNFKQFRIQRYKSYERLNKRIKTTIFGVALRVFKLFFQINSLFGKERKREKKSGIFIWKDSKLSDKKVWKVPKVHPWHKPDEETFATFWFLRHYTLKRMVPWSKGFYGPKVFRSRGFYPPKVSHHCGSVALKSYIPTVLWLLGG